jgi:LmbE family N-acetylglucosaminyl deacetylase
MGRCWIDKAKYAVRRCCGHFFEALLRLHASPWPPRPSSRATLIFAPHPDDETLGCGLLIASRLREGEPVHVAVLTDGAASHPGHPELPPMELRARREEESRRAMRLLGLPAEHLHFLGLPDGDLPRLDKETEREAVRKMRAILERAPFDHIFITWRHDGSSEHEAAFRLVSGNIPPEARLLEYPIWSKWAPWRLKKACTRGCAVYRMSGDGLGLLKKDALQSYETQIRAVAPWPDPVLPAGFPLMFQGSSEYFFEPRLPPGMSSP